MRRILVLILPFFLAAITAFAQSDLGVAKSDSPDPVVIGDLVTHTIIMTNYGPSEASNVVLGETLPASMTLQSLNSPPDWACTAPPADTTGSISCSKLQVATGETASFTIVVKPTTAGMITNIANITASDPDPNPDNNSSTQETMVLSADAPDTSVLGKAQLIPDYFAPINAEP